MAIPAVHIAQLTIKQFAYFGFAITFVSAFIAHISVGDTANHVIMPLIFLVILGISYYYNNQMVKSQSGRGPVNS